MSNSDHTPPSTDPPDIDHVALAAAKLASADRHSAFGIDIQTETLRWLLREAREAERLRATLAAIAELGGSGFVERLDREHPAYSPEYQMVRDMRDRRDDLIDGCAVTIAWGDEGHGGPGWYFWESELPEEGGYGAFATLNEAITGARETEGADYRVERIEGHPLESALAPLVGTDVTPERVAEAVGHYVEAETLRAEREAFRAALINSLAMRSDWSGASAMAFVDTCHAQAKQFSADAARKDPK